LGEKWVKKIASQRYKEHCSICPFNSKNAKEKGDYYSIRPDEHCIDCGCNLDYKTHCMDCSCPKNFWEAIISEEEGIKLEKLLKDEEHGK